MPALSRYLATRGAMLLVLEATWISFSWQFGYNVMILQVLWALGAGMIALSLLVWLPRPVIALVAALLILPHNAARRLASGRRCCGRPGTRAAFIRWAPISASCSCIR